MGRQQLVAERQRGHLWTAVVWPIWVLAAVTVVGFVALGRWTDAVWRRRLRADA